MATAAQFPYVTAQQVSGTYPFGNHAVTLRNPFVLLGKRWRGNNRVIPGQEGSEPYPQVLAQGEHLLELLIKGSVDSDGAPAAHPHAQVYVNLQEAIAAVGPFGADGTRATTMHFPDGSTTVTADCQWSDIEVLNADGPNMTVSVVVIVPAGEFT